LIAIRSADAANPIILSSSWTTTQLMINGSNLAPGTASVLLGSFGPLTVNSQSTNDGATVAYRRGRISLREAAQFELTDPKMRRGTRGAL